MIWKFDQLVINDAEIRARFKGLGQPTLPGSLGTFVKGLTGRLPVRHLDEVECYDAWRSEGNPSNSIDVTTYKLCGVPTRALGHPAGEGRAQHRSGDATSVIAYTGASLPQVTEADRGRVYEHRSPLALLDKDGDSVDFYTEPRIRGSLLQRRRYLRTGFEVGRVSGTDLTRVKTLSATLRLPAVTLQSRTVPSVRLASFEPR